MATADFARRSTLMSAVDIPDVSMRSHDTLRLTSLVLLLTVPIGARAAELDHAAVDRQCADTAQAVPPPSDLPTPAQRQTLAGCDAEALYYGIGHTPSPVQARLCAFVQQAAEGSSQPYGFSGSHMLMVIYANGIGAARNNPYAIHLACTSSWAEAERDSRVAHLLGHREYWYTNQFMFCDDATSGLTDGYCAAHDRRFTRQAEATAIATYAASLPTRIRPAFTALSRAEAIWGEARSRNEVDLTGTSRAAFEIEEEDFQERDFITMLDRLHTRHPPRLGASSLAKAEARMQSVLDRIEQEPDYLQAGTVTGEGVAQAQRAWESYRDAWSIFAGQAYPTWGATGAKAWITMKRADMLSHLHKL